MEKTRTKLKEFNAKRKLRGGMIATLAAADMAKGLGERTGSAGKK